MISKDKNGAPFSKSLRLHIIGLRVQISTKTENLAAANIEADCPLNSSYYYSSFLASEVVFADFAVERFAASVFAVADCTVVVVVVVADIAVAVAVDTVVAVACTVEDIEPVDNLDVAVVADPCSSACRAFA